MATETKVLTAHVPLHLAEKGEPMALEAMEDVDAGRVIDHQAVRAWADSLGTDTPLPPPSA